LCFSLILCPALLPDKELLLLDAEELEDEKIELEVDVVVVVRPVYMTLPAEFVVNPEG